MTWENEQAEVAAAGTARTLRLKNSKGRRVRRVRVVAGVTTIGPGDLDVTDTNLWRIKKNADDTDAVGYTSVQNELDLEYKNKGGAIIFADDAYITFTSRIANLIAGLWIEFDEDAKNE